MRDVQTAIDPVIRPQSALVGNTLLTLEGGAVVDRDFTSPTPLCGCWSELSSCRAQDQVYLDALKSYAQVYAAYQDYLTPEPPMERRDYALGVSATEEHVQLGLLSETGHAQRVSDDDIDDCGYLGWLRH